MNKSTNNRHSRIRLTKDEFVSNAVRIHGNKYDYSEVNYISCMKKVKITCSIHGIFEQKPNAHVSGKQGCPVCSNRKKLTTDEFISNARKIHGDKYDYKLVKYKNNFTKIKIICPVHGIFEQKPNNHVIQKQGCLKCSGRNKKTTEEFVSLSKNVHGNKYDYSFVEYKNNSIKVRIICPEHGEFKQNLRQHITRGQGCPKFKRSIGEELIFNTLSENNINVIQEKRFSDCRDKYPLPFDFYLPEQNICIEYDGLQHYEPVDNWGGYENFMYVKKHDKIKDDYCANNGIKLIRIKYGRKIDGKDILEKINYINE